jgi:2-polyprenyl-3-methyl-5-hydroxy-6-metoxy-1,4-benzoquinol methylase
MLTDTMQVSDAAYAEAMSGEYHQTRLAKALRILGDVHGNRVYDFGCGEGELMRRLSAAGAIVSGCDPSPKLIALAPETATIGGVEALEALPTDSLDVLVTLNVLGYVPAAELARFWPAAARAVKPGGLLLQANANDIAASGRKYTFSADPRTFPETLAGLGWSETGLDYHRYRPFPWTRLLTGKRDVLGVAEQDRIPMFLRQRRSTMYYSLSYRLPSAA